MSGGASFRDYEKALRELLECASDLLDFDLGLQTAQDIKERYDSVEDLHRDVGYCLAGARQVLMDAGVYP